VSAAVALGAGHRSGARDPLSLVFGALADPTRRAILTRLRRGPATVAELSAPFDMSGPAVSKHLRVLERAGLITRGRVAQARPAMLQARPMEKAAAWTEDFRRFWEERYDRLDDLLAATADDAGEDGALTTMGDEQD
jgi:DNA-binding transcriptional ArsR family regulator